MPLPAVPPLWQVTIGGDVADGTAVYRSTMQILINPFTGTATSDAQS
jgi:hypothetical protein